jgi:hypothetical protein
MIHSPEFQEIGHCGGTITFRVVTTPGGGRTYQVTLQGSRPVPMATYSIYALPQGIPVADLNMGGVGSPFPPPPVPGCFPVFISSDSEGKFGFQCPRCNQYWRTRGGANVCPYCGVRAQRFEFLSNAQRGYVVKYCDFLRAALDAEEDDDHVIDMDAVADAAGKDVVKPPFYYAEESQQKLFTCTACGELNDIIGRFGYCSACGTRNDLDEFEGAIVPAIRDDLNAGKLPAECLKSLVSSFDSFVGQYVHQLVSNRPMRSGRRARIQKMRFHDLAKTRQELAGGFDIDICERLSETDVTQATRMFLRRHVYEHNGGEVDEKYIHDSGDTTVRLKQALRETQQSVHDFASLTVAMAKNLHRGFHDIYEPIQGPIDWHNDKKKREAAIKERVESQRAQPAPQTAKHGLRARDQNNNTTK